MRDWDGPEWYMAAISVLLTLALAFSLGGEVLDALDQRSCRNRGGTVDHHDPDHGSDWRCAGGRVER